MRTEERGASGGLWPASLGWLLVNRFQVALYVLFLPDVLIHPYMIWIILLVGVLSHFNLRILSKWLQTEEARLGYEGFVRVLGGRAVRLLAVPAAVVILLESSILTLDYLEVSHHVLFPSVSKLTLLPLLWLASVYLASQGMILTGRFVIIAFIGSLWIMTLFLQFLFPPVADYAMLLPLVPQKWDDNIPYILLTLWAAMAGPQYLAFTGSRFASTSGMFRWLALGNALSVLEYVVFFLAVTLAFGPEYMRKLDYPVVQLVRYIELPFFERLETIVVPFHMIVYIFLDAFFILILRDVLRIATGNAGQAKGFFGLAAVLWLVFIYLFGKYFWASETRHLFWIHFHSWLTGAAYALVPSFLALAALWRKRKRKRS